MRGPLIVLFGAVVSFLSPLAVADLSSFLLHRIAEHADPYDRDRSTTDADLGFVGLKESEAVPANTPTTPRPHHEEHLSRFNLGPVEGRFSSRSLKTGFAVGGGSAKAQIGYHGDRRLQFDRPTYGGTTVFSLSDELDGTKALRIEFKHNF